MPWNSEELLPRDSSSGRQVSYRYDCIVEVTVAARTRSLEVCHPSRCRRGRAAAIGSDERIIDIGAAIVDNPIIDGSTTAFQLSSATSSPWR